MKKVKLSIVALILNSTFLIFNSQQANAQSISITADFANRLDTAYKINANLFGVAGSSSSFGTYGVSTWNVLKQSGIANVRIGSNVPSDFATQTPNWSHIDSLVTHVVLYGAKPIFLIAYTPQWLLPGTNPCTTGVVLAHAPPTDTAKWAWIAAQYVHHLDSLFPGVVQDYEIWNEPDGPTFLCCPNESIALSTYLSIYASAARHMRAQATADGQSIRIGGPALANPTGHISWLDTLVHNPSTAPYVDFISYHHYLSGCGIDTTWYELLSSTQKATSGVSAVYGKVATAVHSGTQPNAAHTPIYLDEYNTNACTTAIDSFRNKSPYSEVWNSLFVADILNCFYQPTPSIPARLYYFGLTSPANGFCLFGTTDAAMDCNYVNGTTPQPYPQYYAYKLIGDTSYLGLKAGGYMADSSLSVIDSLKIAAFYTSNADNVLIVNPTVTSYSQLHVLIKNPGFAPPLYDSMYVLNKTNPQITSYPLTYTVQGNDFVSVIDVPALSAIGLTYHNVGSTAIMPAFISTIPHVTIYPNPTRDILNVELNAGVPSGSLRMQNAELKITDMLGSIHSTFIIQNSPFQISVADLSEGVYNVSLLSNEGIINKRLVIVR